MHQPRSTDMCVSGSNHRHSRNCHVAIARRYIDQKHSTEGLHTSYSLRCCSGFSQRLESAYEMFHGVFVTVSSCWEECSLQSMPHVLL